MIFGTLAAAHVPKSDSATAGMLIIRLHVYHFIPLQHTDKATCPSALDLVKHFTEGEQSVALHTPATRLLSQPCPTFHCSLRWSSSFSTRTEKSKPQNLSWLETFVPLAHEWNPVWEQCTILYEGIIQIFNKKKLNCYLVVGLLEVKIIRNVRINSTCSTSYLKPQHRELIIILLIGSNVLIARTKIKFHGRHL